MKHSEVYFTTRDKRELAAIVRVTHCPNPECKKYVLDTILIEKIVVQDDWNEGEATKEWTHLREWRLVPDIAAKVFPDYVPEGIRSNYTESCSILDKSPKAAATLARRCLQGMIRDYWGVTKANLFDEIKAIQDKVDPDTWKAIDSVRKLGNIGAHMEKDVDIIIDVEPDEAERLVRLVESLIKDWYIARHDRQKHLADVVALADDKERLRGKKVDELPSGVDGPTDETT